LEEGQTSSNYYYYYNYYANNNANENDMKTNKKIQIIIAI